MFAPACRSEKDIERLNTDRAPLNMGLRVVEDIPELVIGLVDLVAQLLNPSATHYYISRYYLCSS